MGNNQQITFNPSKCEFLQLTKKRHPLTSHYHLDNRPIQQATAAKYLGAIIDKGSIYWNEDIRMVINKANSALGFLQRNIIRKCSVEVKCLCY